MDSIEFIDTVNITKGKENKTDDYISVKNMKVKNNFKDFEYSNTEKEKDFEMKWYKLYSNEDKDKIKASISIGVGNMYIDYFISNYNDKVLGISKGFRKEIIEKNNITNDIEFLRYIKKFKNTKANIFTSTNKIKEIFSIKNYIPNLPEFKNLKLIDGDYIGYTFDIFGNNNSVFKEYIILKDNKKYFVEFFDYDNYFTNEQINDTINNINIE